MRHTRTILACAVAFSAGACGQTPTTPSDPALGVVIGSGHTVAPPPTASYEEAPGGFIGGGHLMDSGTTTNPGAPADTTATARGNYFGSGN